MVEQIIISGAGGQGIMLLGKVLAEAAMLQSLQVTWLPSYGAEVRGGTAHCMVIVSDAPIGSPYIQQADSLVVMNVPSLRRFKTRVKKGGLLIINSSLVGRDDGIDTARKVFRHPFTEIASELGNVKVANMVALGVLITQRKIIKPESVFKAMRLLAPKGKNYLIEINEKALAEGMKLR